MAAGLGPQLYLMAGRAEALARYHAETGRHGDLDPGAITTDTEGTVVVHPPRAQPGGDLTELLRYASPAVAGRVPSDDVRDDLYSLGAIMYHELAGQPPFTADDALGIVHQVIAVDPPPLGRIRPDLPEPVVAIVHRLLEKAPNRRYASAASLAADLRHCAAEVSATGTVAGFDLGAADHGAQFAFPARLYGRQGEARHLIELIDRTIAGRGQVCLVTGTAGSGKTALVHGARAHAVARHAMFVEGRFDQHRTAAPYSAILGTAAMALEQVLSLPASEVGRRRAEVIVALDELAPAVAELLPEIELLIGQQDAPAPLAPAAAKARLHTAVRRLLGALATAEHPLVAFVDDLQWADPASIDLIVHLTAGGPLAHVSMIGAVRHDEPGPAERLSDLARLGPDVFSTIRLGPLGQAELAELVADTWVPLDGADRLADLVLRKTGGNPRHVRRFLQALADQGGLNFHPDTRRWAWDESVGDHLAVSENVIDTVTARIAEFPDDVRAALRVAAAIGSQFEVDLVAAVLGTAEVEALVLLAPAVDFEVLVPVADAVRPTLRFAHDRVLRAAYDGPPEALARIHRQVAEAMQADPDIDDAFEVTDQFNLARLALADPGLRLVIARRNLAAGQAALRAGADAGAAGYLANGIALLPPDAWQQHYELARDLHLRAAEAESRLGHHDRFDTVVAPLAEHAADGADTIRVLAERTTHALRQGHLATAVDIALTGLAAGTAIAGPWPPGDRAAALDAALDRCGELLAGRPAVEVVAGLAPADDPEVIAVLDLTGRIVDVLGLIDINLFRVICARVTVTVLEHGTHPAAGPALVGMASALTARRRPPDELEDIAGAGLAVAGHDPQWAVPAEVSYLRFVHGWTHPLSELVERATRVAATSLRSHDPNGAAYADVIRTVAAFCLMRSVSEVWSGATVDEHHDAQHLADTAADTVTHPLVGAARALAGLTTGLTDLGPGLAEPGAAAGLPARTTTRHSAGILVHALADEHSTVLALVDELGSDRTGTLTRLPNAFWAGIAHAALADDDTDDESSRERHVAGVAAAIDHLGRFAAGAGSANVAHRITFLEGERARLAGDDPVPWYRAAIGQALDHEYILECGYVLERYGRWLHASRAAPARVRQVWEMALGAYRACAAHALVARLERSLAVWSAPEPAVAGRFDPIDTQAILSAVQTITSERDLDVLLDRLLTIMVASAGADRGVIARRVGDEFEVEARSANAPEALPLGLMRFVLNSGQPIAVRSLDQAAGAAAMLRFGPDGAAAIEGVASLLCLPIGRRPPLRRVLYLAHGGLADAFADDSRRGVLEWLTEQAAISVDNAETYDELEQLVTARTRELSDVNELLRRHQVDLRRAKDGAEEATRAKSEFLANMSHEVRTPMNAILGLTELMLREERDPVQLDRLVKLERSAATLMGLLDDVLDYSKVEGGKLDLEHTAFDLTEVLTAAVQVAQVAGSRKDLPIRLRVAGDVPPAVVGDPLRLGQVLRNLLSNAVKFTSHGEVRVDTTVAPAELPGFVDVTVTVADTGVGIRPDTLGRLFQPFTQADASTSRQYGGTGLGLAITARLVELMGGRIDVASEPMVGSRFTVQLRLGASTEPRPAVPPPIAQTGGLDGVRVLLVEDNDLNREVATALLERFGATVTTAGDGLAAVAALAATPTDFDIVLMDCQMPVLDGYAATARIRGVPEHSDLPIVAMTANALPGDRERALDAGMNGHVGKPVSSTHLVQVVRAWARPPRTPDELRAASGCLYGLDVEAALERVPSVTDLGGLLARFGAANAGLADRIGAAFTEGGREGIGALVHTVSGTAGMLGAHAVDSAGRELMQAVRAGAPDLDVSQAIVHLGVEFERTMRTATLLTR